MKDQEIDPSLRKYLRTTKLPEVYEALLAGLAIMQPANPYSWIAEKLYCLQDIGLQLLDWDSFIDEDKKPKESPFVEKGIGMGMFMGHSLQFGMDSDTPTAEMISKAYTHYNKKAYRKYFDAWIQHHFLQRIRKKQKRIYNAKADSYFFKLRAGQVFSTWLEWTRFRKGRQAMAYQLIQRVFHISLLRVMFHAWHGVSLEARRTREYFELELRRLERGENVGDDDDINQTTGEARDDLTTLSDELRKIIFTNLNLDDLGRAACVCRAWKMHTQNPDLLQKINLSVVSKKISSQVAKKVLTTARAILTQLNLAHCTSLTVDVFQAVSDCRNLQDLNLSECTNVDDDILADIVQGCPLLLYLNVSFTNITDNALRNMSKYAENLECVSVAGCSKISDNGISLLTQKTGAHKMVHLDLSYCDQLTSSAYDSVARGFCFLKRIHLNDIKSLRDEHIQAITRKCQKIEHWELMGASEITDESIKSLAIRRLHVLKLDKNHVMTDTALRHLGKCCPDLHHLYLADCQKLTDNGIKYLSSLKHLRVLNMADCVRITDAGARLVAESLYASSIRELNLTNAVRLTDHGVNAISKKALGLTHLNISFCEGITNNATEGLSNLPNLVSLDISGSAINDSGVSKLVSIEKLKCIYLGDCSTITDLGVQKLAQALRNLEQVDLSFCMPLTDGGIKNLVFCCRLITHLRLRGCRQLTDLATQYLSGVCHYLIYLDLSQCPMITDKSLKFLKKSCKRLHTLEIQACPGISRASVIRMTKKIPQVVYSQENSLPS